MFRLPRRDSDRVGRLPAFSVPATSISVLETPDSFRCELINMIRSASRRIYITALYLQDDECGRMILDELYKRAQECPSLKIYILVDFHRAQRGLMGKGKQCGNNVMYRQYMLKYPDAKISFLGVPVKTKEVFGVLHLKGFIFDDTVFYSGASINNVYLGYEGKYRLDRYQKIESPELAGCMTAYLLNFIISSPAVTDLTQETIPTAKEIGDKIGKFKRLLKRSSYDIAPMQRGDGCLAVTPLCGLGNGLNRLNRTIISLMRMTKKKIVICTPYFNMPASVSRTVTNLLERGVETTLIIGDKVANDFYIPEDQPFNRVAAVPYLYEGFIREFCRKHQAYIDSRQLNVMMWKDGSNTYHVKGIYIDDTCYLLTGNNLNPRAWRLDIENGIVLQDPQRLMKDKFEHEINYILDHTTRISHWTEIEKFDDFPERVKNYMKKIMRLKLHMLIKRII